MGRSDGNCNMLGHCNRRVLKYCQLAVQGAYPFPEDEFAYLFLRISR